MPDLFGGPDPVQRSKHYIRQRGYAGIPGNGPIGMTCADCKHIHRGQRFRKCGLNKARWTHGPASDILARSPACEKFEKE